MGPELAWIKKDFNNANFEDKPWVKNPSCIIRHAAMIDVLNSNSRNYAKKNNDKFHYSFLEKDGTKWLNWDSYSKLQIKVRIPF